MEITIAEIARYTEKLIVIFPGEGHMTFSALLNDLQSRAHLTERIEYLSEGDRS